MFAYYHYFTLFRFLVYHHFAIEHFRYIVLSFESLVPMPSLLSRSSRSSSTTSARSTGSGHTYATNLTSYSDMRPSLHHSESSPAKLALKEDGEEVNEEYCDPHSSASSVSTYASTVSSREDLAAQPEYELPTERHVRDSEALPTNATDFAMLFPTTRRLLIQHDDSTSDGNMNVRVDIVARTSSGARHSMILFHLRMKNLYERQFSLRRYCRESGREVCSSRKKYVKPVAQLQPRKRPSVVRAFTTSLQGLGARSPKRQDSGYESDDADELESELKRFTMSSDVQADVPTNIIRLEFSNYAQVEVHRRRHGGEKQWDFEYWGEPYSWKRGVTRDEYETFCTYDLVSSTTGGRLAYIVPDQLGRDEAAIEESQGGWIPPSSMRIEDSSISEDLGDVIISTGLIILTDDCIKRRWHNKGSTRISVPVCNGPNFDPEELVDRIFPR